MGLLVILLIIFGIVLIYRQSELADNSEIPLPFDNATASPLPEISEGQVTPENIFLFEGYFLEKPTINNDVVMGNFIWNEDPNQSPISVLFTTTQGNFYIGSNTGEQTNFELVSTDKLIEFIEPNTRYELRVIPVDTESELGQESIVRLNQLKVDEDIQGNEYSIVPTMIRNIE